MIHFKAYPRSGTTALGPAIHHPLSKIHLKEFLQFPLKKIGKEESLNQHKTNTKLFSPLQKKVTFPAHCQATGEGGGGTSLALTLGLE